MTLDDLNNAIALKTNIESCQSLVNNATNQLKESQAAYDAVDDKIKSFLNGTGKLLLDPLDKVKK